jgi:Ulp1 family protease
MLKKGETDFKKLERGLQRKKVNLLDYKCLLLPINIEKYHWFMLVADLTKNKFSIIDSMKGTT